MKKGRRTNRKAGGHWSKMLVFLACVVVFCTTYALILPAITMEVETSTEISAVVEAGTANSETPETTAANTGELTAADGETAGTENTAASGSKASEAMVSTDNGTTASDSDTTGSTDSGASASGTTANADDGSITSGITDSTGDGVTVSGNAEGTAAGTSGTETTESTAYGTDGDTGSLGESTDTSASEATSATEASTETEADTAAENETTASESEDESLSEAESETAETESETETEVETESETETETEADVHSYTYEDDNIFVEVSLPLDSTVPEDAVLMVTAITEEDDNYNYEDLTGQAESAVEGEIEEVYFYDISFFTTDGEDGEYIPVSDEATVILTYKEKTLAQEDSNSSVSVLHYEEDDAEPVVLEKVEITGDGESEPEKLTFQTEGFSVFAVVTVAADTSSVSLVTITDSVIDSLNGSSYIIADHSGTKAMLAQSYNTSGLSKADVSSSSSQWTFTATTGGYYISSNGSYLKMSYSSAQYGDLSLVSNVNDATIFTVDKCEINNTTYLAIYATVDNITYYINQSGGTTGTIFLGYTTPAASGPNSRLLLYTVTTGTTSGSNPTVTDLDGKSYAIVNLNTSARTYALLSTADSNGGLSGGKVSVLEDSNNSGTTYVVGEDITIWTFEATSVAGVYYIYTTDTNGDKLYLNITGTSQNSVKTSSTPVEITVAAGTGNREGQVKLYTSQGALNWYGGSNASNLVFGGYNYTGDGPNAYQTLCEVKEISGTYLVYDLNLAGDVSLDTASGSGWYINEGDTWVSSTTPSIPDIMQTVTGSDTLYDVSGKGDNGYYTYVSGQRLTIAQQLIAAGKSPGKEFRFDGWKATVTDDSGAKVTYTFDAEATIEGIDSYGNILIYDTNGDVITLPNGTVLTGIWTEISDIVMFFVNYKGTVLDVEGDVSGRNQNLFTGIIAIGHVYFGATEVGTDSTFAAGANESIREKFKIEENLSSTDTQIVIDYVTTYNSNYTNGYYYYTSAYGINDSILDESLLQFIRENSSITIQISTAEGNNPTIDNAHATSDNYTVRWYVLKEQVDGWHIDGVMVAKTEEVKVTKTFNGLEESEVDGILSSYQMPFKLGTGTSAQDYVTIKTTKTTTSGKTEDGVYEYEGKLDGDSLSYRWVVHAITGETYTLSEENYTLTGYDVCTMAVHYYEDANGNEVSESVWTTTSGDFVTPIEGAVSTGFTFDNFYTETGTGMLALIKTDESGNSLSGATFTLTEEGGSGSSVTVTSTSSGLVFFNNLDTGTYILTEKKAPTGYQESNATWKVVVEKNGSTDVKVTVYESEVDPLTGEITYSTTGTVYYDSSADSGNTSTVSNKMQYMYAANEAANTTVQITKTFSGLTYADLEELYAASTSANDYETNGNSNGYDRLPYYIELTCSGQTSIKLYLQEATRSQTGTTFTWTLADVAAEEWTVTEYNYLHEDYIDTAVTATVNETTASVTVTGSSAKTASFSATFSDSQKDTVTINNNYTSTFTLRLSKVDSETGEPLAGAVFDIYGPYSESTDQNKSISYTDADGTHKLYYITYITSDENGIATIDGLTLSSDSSVYVYVLDESTTPYGYKSSGEQKIITVAVDTNGYSAGVYSLEVENTKVTTTSLTAKKVWNPSLSSASNKQVTLVLYKEDSEGNVTEVSSIVLDGTTESVAWTASWDNLEVWEQVQSVTDPGTYTYENYTYYVAEVSMNGFETTYSLDYTDADTAYTAVETETIIVGKNGGNETVEAVEATMGNGTLSTVTVINSAVYELPKTGGTGEWPCYLVSLLLAAMTLIIYNNLITRQNGETKGETGK